MATFARRRGAVSDGVNYVEYIQSSGTQYIDTGFKPNQNTRVVVDFEMSGGANEVLYGARVSSSSDGICFFKRSAGYFCSQYNDTLLNTTVAHDTNRHTVDANKNVTHLDGIAVATFTAGTFTAPGTLVLFASNDNGAVKYNASAKIYSCQIYDNGTLVRDYRPCYDPEGVACLYDKVTKTYFYNQGSGKFGTPDAPPEAKVSLTITGDVTTAKNNGIYIYINDLYQMKEQTLSLDIGTVVKIRIMDYGYSYNIYLNGTRVMSGDGDYNLTVTKNCTISFLTNTSAGIINTSITMA